MNESERYLRDIATRMLDGREIAPILAQLKEIQKTLNTCAWALALIFLGVLAISIQLMR